LKQKAKAKPLLALLHDLSLSTLDIGVDMCGEQTSEEQVNWLCLLLHALSF
jgi:hypothetical protein